MNAYGESYIERARVVLGGMLEYAVKDLQMQLAEIYTLFLSTGIASRFERGEAQLTVGNSGAELAFKVLERAGMEKRFISPSFSTGRSREFWAGWALAWYQWKNNVPFSVIERSISIENIRELYDPYHEMDIRQFADKVDGYVKRHEQTTLARLRKYAQLSQGMLAKQSGVSVRTIQQYEQRQKDLSKAGNYQLTSLSRVLCCSVEKLGGV